MLIQTEHQNFIDIISEAESLPETDQVAYIRDRIAVRSVSSFRLFINRNPDIAFISELKSIHDTACIRETRREFSNVIGGLKKVNAPAVVLSYIGLACSVLDSADLYLLDKRDVFSEQIEQGKTAVPVAIKEVIAGARDDFTFTMRMILKVSTTEEIMNIMVDCVRHEFIDQIDPELESLLVEAKLSLNSA